MRNNGRPPLAASELIDLVYLRESGTHSVCCPDCGQWQDLRKGQVANPRPATTDAARGRIMDGQPVRLITPHRPRNGARCLGSGQRIVLDVTVQEWLTRLNRRPRRAASSLPITHLDLTAGQRPSAVCGDCGTWRLLHDTVRIPGPHLVRMIAPHPTRSGRALCPGSSQRIVLDVAPERWQQAMDRLASRMETRGCDPATRQGTTLVKKPAPKAPAVLHLRPTPAATGAQATLRTARADLERHRANCTRCQPRTHGQTSSPCAAGRRLQHRLRTQQQEYVTSD
jgi:hypothetical protein